MHPGRRQRKAACLAPCALPAGEPAAAARSGGGREGEGPAAVPAAAAWSEVCWKHFAEPTCAAIVRARGVRPGSSWGGAPAALRRRWARLDCEKYILAEDVALLAATAPPPSSTPLLSFGAAAPAPTAAAGTAASAAGGTTAGGLRAIDPTAVHCVAPSEGVLLLMVSDRPNQFLCASLATALTHGLSPTLLGWDPSSWLAAQKKPWR